MFPEALLRFCQSAPAPAAPPRGESEEDAFAHLRWLTVPALAPYRVLDCRALALSLSSATSDASVAAMFASLRADDGERLRAQVIESALVVEARTPLDAVQQGIVFRAPEMEWKWDATRVGDRLVFSRSWSGLPRIAVYPDRIEVGRELCNGDATAARCLVQYMLHVYVLASIAPHPLPPGSPTSTPRDAFLYSFSVHGRAAFFAAPPLPRS